MDVKISCDTRYRPDWLDRLEKKQGSWEDRIAGLEEKEKELRQDAIDKATRTKLPQLLKRVVPTFVRSKLNPLDVKSIFHPIDFVAFDGMNEGDVDQVVLMDRKTTDKSRKAIQRSISNAIESEAVEWKTVRGVSGDINIE